MRNKKDKLSIQGSTTRAAQPVNTWYCSQQFILQLYYIVYVDIVEPMAFVIMFIYMCIFYGHDRTFL